MRHQSRARKRRRRHLQIEQLEQRQLLVGNVTAAVQDGNLVLEADSQDNQFEVTVFDGDVSVRTRSGTRINGRPGRYVAFPDTSTIPGSLIIRLGGGDDAVVISRDLHVARDLRIEAGAGDDIVGIFNASVGRNFKAVLGSGHDGVSIAGATVAGMSVLNGNNGRDVFRLAASTELSALKVTTGGGNDSLIGDRVEFKDNVSITTGSGNDAVGFASTRMRADLDLTTVAGNDAVQLTSSRILRRTFVGMGSGDDDLALGAPGARNVFAGDLSANGSGGSDDYQQRNNVFRGSRSVTRFSQADIDGTRIENAEARAERVHRVAAELFVYREQDLTAKADDVQESVGTVITKADHVEISGRTTNDAVIRIDSDGDGDFDDATSQADEFGRYEVNVNLAVGGQTILIQSIDAAGTEQTVELPVHRAVGSVARFKTSLGFFDVELLDEDAPKTVANYKAYFDEYADALIHRSANNFVIQGGGFAYRDGNVEAIDTNDPVENEFNPENSNVRGTVSTALRSGQPDSATNQWFINLKDNSFLDTAKHTVFGRVIGEGMTVVDAIAQLDVFNLDNGVFRETPLRDYRIFSKELTGTISASSGSSVLTGTGTLFTQELDVGTRVRIMDGDQIVGDYTVAAISSDTELAVNRALPEFTEGKLLTHKQIDEDHFVFGDIDEILDF